MSEGEGEESDTPRITHVGRTSRLGIADVELHDLCAVDLAGVGDGARDGCARHLQVATGTIGVCVCVCVLVCVCAIRKGGLGAGEKEAYLYEKVV